MEKFTGLFLRACLGLVPIIGILWVFSVPDYFRITLTFQEVVATILGLAIAASFVKHPYGARANLLDVGLAVAAFACWFWMAWRIMMRLPS